MKYIFAALLLFTASLSGGYCFRLYIEQAESYEISARPVPAETETIPATDAAENPLEKPTQPPFDSGFRIVVNLASRGLSLYDHGIQVRLYPVAVGKEWTPTPTGTFIVMEKQEDPEWVDPHQEEIVVPAGEDNPLGTRWLGLGNNYGIHGTNSPSSIGDYISNGCIRMYDEDAQELFSLIPVGTPVEIIYNRIVADRQTDGTVSLYCYPDGYEWQTVDTKDAIESLQRCGVQDFADLSAVAAHIEASSGEPLFIAQSYPVISNETNLNFFAVQSNGSTYIPATPLFSAFQTQWEWNAEKKEIKSNRRTIPAMQKGTGIYLNADQLGKALRVTGTINNAGQFELTPAEKK